MPSMHTLHPIHSTPSQGSGAAGVNEYGVNEYAAGVNENGVKEYASGTNEYGVNEYAAGEGATHSP